MATITLYKDKVNGVGGLIDDIIKSANNLSVQLGTLKNTLQGVDSSTCNLQDTVDSISSSSKSEDEKIDDLKTLNSKLTDFIEMTSNRDASAKSEINKAKEEFYTKYSYLKPECEKSTWERIKDGLKKAAEWCKKHWKEILIALEVLTAIVCLCIPGLQGVGVAILTNMLKGLVIGALVGAVIGGISGYAQYGVKGILGGMLNGLVDGALMGAAFGGISGLGAGLGAIGHCSNAINAVFKVSSVISVGMQAFDMAALGDMFLMRLSKDLHFHYGGGQIAAANAKAHSNPFYNALQMGVGFTAAFTGGYKSTAKCFVAGTLVLTANGVVAIEMIKAGDMVYSAHEETLEYGIKPVVETYIRETSHLVHITVNGEEIVSTVDHPYYVKGKGFVKAADLCIGFELMDNNGNTLIVEQIFRETLHDETVKVYNFKVDEYHTYFVGEHGMLVHNSQCPPEMKLKIEKESREALEKWINEQKSKLTGKEKKSFNTASVAYDEATGKRYFGRNGGYKADGYEKNRVLFGDDTQPGLLPKESLNKYPVGNCSEVDAVNRALNDGADISNLHLTTVHATKGRLGEYKPSCENCTYTFKGKVSENYSGWLGEEK
ncbi:MAG: hypothetical protein IJJ76_06180 [Ruminococcus sp.]|uniref:polymorphic toxin-type HINT domain-containing protein n=1 Tax=Ruminococcus sp. TaxID=41978 RepID=UPI0025D285DF|nr:polymorphic toxin-type HINT domain-containing protein [Ruminococcus sp.]MBR0529341.1 hypothetical protein [Ruminococcus sp.]